MTTLNGDLECPICLEDSDSIKVKFRECNHFTCLECLVQLIIHSNNNVTCPLCRKLVNSYYMYRKKRQAEHHISIYLV